MTFDKLSNNTVLVELTGEDMSRYAITYETLNYSCAQTQTAVKKLLSRAAELQSADGCESVTVEALPAADGGCFFIFTFNRKKRRYRVKAPCGKRVLRLEKTDGLLDFFRAAVQRDSGGTECEIIKCGSGLYLTLASRNKRLEHIMSEFGDIYEYSELQMLRLREQGTSMGTVRLG